MIWHASNGRLDKSDPTNHIEKCCFPPSQLTVKVINDELEVSFLRFFMEDGNPRYFLKDLEG